jgi:hypothetical protein
LVPIWFSFFLLCGTGVWTQGLHLEPLHHPFSVKGFFEKGSHELFHRDWLSTSILLISDSWVARITGMSHRHPAWLTLWKQDVFSLFFPGKIKFACDYICCKK